MMLKLDPPKPKVIVADSYHYFMRICMELDCNPNQVHYVNMEDVDTQLRGYYSHQVWPSWYGDAYCNPSPEVLALESSAIMFKKLADALEKAWDVFKGFPRRSNENLLEWGNRLNKQSLLDNPQIRWEYQKQVWLAIIRFPITMINRLKKGSSS